MTLKRKKKKIKLDLKRMSKKLGDSKSFYKELIRISDLPSRLNVSAFRYKKTEMSST